MIYLGDYIYRKIVKAITFNRMLLYSTVKSDETDFFQHLREFPENQGDLGFEKTGIKLCMV